MKQCPFCGYHFEAFDTVCPRCHGQGLRGKAISEEPLKIVPVESTPESLGGTLRGGLLFLLPAFFITLSFTLDYACNAINRDKHGIDFSFATFVSMFLFVPLCVLEGAPVGAWLGSSFPVQIVRKAATTGALCAIALCALITLASIVHFDAVLFGLIPLVFIGVVFSGAYGGVECLRNGHGDNDGQLFGLLGVGVLSACIPCIGFMLIMALTRSNSEKAPAAIWGTIMGVAIFVVIVLMAFSMPN